MKKIFTSIFTFIAMMVIFSISAAAQQPDASVMKTAVPQYDASIPYFETVEAAADYVLECYKKRMETVKYYLPVEIDRYDFMDIVFRHTGVPDEGDYQKRLYQLGGDFRDSYDCGDYYLYEHTFYTYVTTLAQEQQATKKVDSIIASLDLDGKDDYQKIEAIANYICDNVNYDYNYEYSDRYIAYGALIDGMAVCDGYAQITYRLMLEAGIDCRYISGQTSAGVHAWNIVKLKGKYYNIDITWMDTGDMDSWFLKGSEDFNDHTRYDIYNTEDFNKQYPTAKTEYVAGLVPPVVTVKNDVATGKPVVTWNTVEGAAKYQVYRSTSKNGTYTLLKTLTGTSLTNTSTTAGTTYYYKVRALHTNSEQNSEFSAVVARTCDLPRPTVTLSNVASTGKIKISWNKVEGASKYEVYRSTSKNGTYTLLKTMTGTSLTNTSTTAGTTYYYKIRALHTNSAANSAYSAVVYRTCDLPAPTVTLSNVASTGKIKISWNKVEGASKYEVYRSTSKDGTYTLLKTMTGTSLTNTSTTAGTTYYYKVRAIHTTSAANSANSAIVYRTCDLARPTVTLKLNTSGKPVISWNKVEGASKYEVYRSTSKDGTYTLLKTMTGTSLTNTSTTAGTTYYYKVRAIHTTSAANSAYSAVKSIASK